MDVLAKLLPCKSFARHIVWISHFVFRKGTFRLCNDWNQAVTRLNTLVRGQAGGRGFFIKRLLENVRTHSVPFPAPLELHHLSRLHRLEPLLPSRSFQQSARPSTVPARFLPLERTPPKSQHNVDCGRWSQSRFVDRHPCISFKIGKHKRRKPRQDLSGKQI